MTDKPKISVRTKYKMRSPNKNYTVKCHLGDFWVNTMDYNRGTVNRYDLHCDGRRGRLVNFDALRTNSCKF